MKSRLTTPQRTILALIAGLSALTAVGVGVVGALYAASPGQTPGVASRYVTVNLGTPVAMVLVDTAIQVTAPAGATFRMLDGGGHNHAGDATASGWFVRTPKGLALLAWDSSHLGCHVYFDSVTTDFVDPCGGSVFAIDGAVIHGPAAYPLSHLAWREVGPDSIGVETV